MNAIHLETEHQAVEHTKLMVSHLRKEDEVGFMLQTSIDQLQIQACSVSRWIAFILPTSEVGP
jgi:hypothetical protein